MKIKNLLFSILVSSVMLVSGAAAQIGIEIRPRVIVGIEVGAPPICDYGYYDYEPYACAPYGFYGDGYFYNGIFLGVGPWGGWGYSHGWGNHRFRDGGRGGSYRGDAGRRAHDNGMRGGRERGDRGRGGRDRGHEGHRPR